MKERSYFSELRSGWHFFQSILKTMLRIETVKKVRKTDEEDGKGAEERVLATGIEENAQEQNLPFKSDAILALSRYYQLEEEIASCSFSTEMTREEENEVAQLTDSILTGKPLKGYTASHYYKAYQTSLAGEAMSLEAGEWYPLPPALRKTVQAAFSKKGRSQLQKAVERASLLIEIGREGLRVLEAELNGFTESWPSAVATRSTALSWQELPAHKRKHVVLRRPVRKQIRHKREDSLECEILRELGNSLTMVVRVPLSCLKTRVDLIQNGKILDTRAFAISCTAVSFEHLRPGRYNLLFKGAIQNDFTVIISESKAA